MNSKKLVPLAILIVGIAAGASSCDKKIDANSATAKVEAKVEKLEAKAEKEEAKVEKAVKAKTTSTRTKKPAKKQAKAKHTAHKAVATSNNVPNFYGYSDNKSNRYTFDQ